MSRDELIKKMCEDAYTLTCLRGKYSKKKEDAIWNKCTDWNSENPDQEIFMCEKYSDVKPNTCIGFYIEDDYFIFPEFKDPFERGEI